MYQDSTGGTNAKGKYNEIRERYLSVRENRQFFPRVACYVLIQENRKIASEWLGVLGWAELPTITSRIIDTQSSCILNEIWVFTLILILYF